MANRPITTAPKSFSQLKIVIDRLRQHLTSVDSKVVDDGTATVILAIGDVVYPPSSGNYDKAIATTVPTSLVAGIVIQAAAVSGPTKVQTSGIVQNPAWALTTDQIYYLSSVTAGDLVAVPVDTAGLTVMPVGIAVSATKLKLLSTTPVLL